MLYRLLVSLARLAVRSGRSKDLEIIVLRHQLGVLRRHNSRPQLTDEDGLSLDPSPLRSRCLAEWVPETVSWMVGRHFGTR